MKLRQLTCERCEALFLVEDLDGVLLWRRFCDGCWAPPDEPTTVRVTIKTEYRWKIPAEPRSPVILADLSTV